MLLQISLFEPNFFVFYAFYFDLQAAALNQFFVPLALQGAGDRKGKAQKRAKVY